MKKFYLAFVIIAIAMAPFTGNSQNLVLNGELELWDDDNNPTSWDKAENIFKESTEIHGGTYSAAHESASSTKDFQQNVEGIVGGSQYTISYYYKDNDPMARTRIWSYWLSAGSTIPENEEELRPNTYSEDNAEWQHFSTTITAPATADGFRFEVRVYKQDDMTGGRVYYDDFSVEGATTNYPEPSNYPTDFEASVNALNVTLDWTDATGDQLPGAYLLLGQKESSRYFQIPVDGTPVADDLDWSDGQVAVNVSYGNESYTFPGLEGGATYEFTIYPYTNVGANIDYKTDGTPPTTSAMVSEINVINEENFNDGTLGTWSEYSVVGAQKWYADSYGGDSYAKMSGYDGGAVENEDWLLSPKLSLPTDDAIQFRFISAMNYEALPIQLFVSTDYTLGDPNDVEWTEITDQAIWSAGSWAWTESGDVDLASYGGMEITLGFKYRSTTDGAATWEIDDIIVYSEGGVSVAENETEQLRFYPNPATNVVNLNSLQSGVIRITNLTGQVVYQSEITTGTTSIDVSTLNRGLYLIQFIGNGNKLVTGKLMVK